MPRTYPRAERVERLAQEVLGEALQELKDPRIGFVTVTSVKMSPDLRQARVFVSVLGADEAREASMEAIRHAVPHLRATLGREVRRHRDRQRQQSATPAGDRKLDLREHGSSPVL